VAVMLVVTNILKLKPRNSLDRSKLAVSNHHRELDRMQTELNPRHTPRLHNNKRHKRHLIRLRGLMTLMMIFRFKKRMAA
jgi:hypothetical protein